MANEHYDMRALFRKFLLGKSSKTEKEQVLEALENAEQDAEFMEALEQLPKDVTEYPEIDDRTREKLFSRINTHTQPEKKRTWTVLSIAATVTLLIALGGGAYFLSHVLFDIQPSITYDEKSAPIGQRKFFTLDDGSVVNLNGGSKVRYSSDYGDQVREVVLEGEGFFEVVRQEETPFIVRTSTLETKVLGTSFNVKAYPDQDQITVAVLTGSVQVLQRDTTADDKSKTLAVLTPDHIVTYDKESGSYETRESSVTELIGWREGRLVFREDTFEDIAHTLKNQYGITIRFGDESLKKCHFTASFGADATLEEILELLTLVHDTQYKKKGASEYIMYGQGC